MPQTPNFGFTLPQPGDLVFGKILNDILMEIDAKLSTVLNNDLEQEAGAVAVLASAGLPAGGAWTPVVLDAEKEFKFASDVTVRKFRIIVPTSATTQILQFALALAYAPLVPITAPAEIPAGVAADVVALALAGAAALNTDEIILIGRPKTLISAGALAVEVVIEVAVDLG